MRADTILVTHKGMKKEIKFILYDDDLKAYEDAWKRSPDKFVWYERLGFKARGHVDSEGAIHLLTRDVKLLAHEVLHKFGVHHPNSFLPALQHVLSCEFGMASFSGVFRWYDREGIYDEAARVMKRLTR